MTRGKRCLAVWLGVTFVVALGQATVGAAAATALTGPWQGLAFDAVLVRGAAVVAALAGAWVWLVTTVTTLQVALRPGAAARAGGPVRRLVLAACGIALVGGALAAPASATPGWSDRDHVTGGHGTARLVTGLPLPDRASVPVAADPPHAVDRSTARPAAHRTPVRASSVVVAAGDSLWSIAAATLPPGAAPAAVDRRWRELYAANRDAIGADPHLIVPGLRLVLPPS